MNNTITLPVIVDDILFGELVRTPVIIFNDKFKNSSGFQGLPQNTFIRYGKRGNEDFIIIERYLMFAKVVCSIREKYPEYDITCLVKNGNSQTNGKVLSCINPDADPVWDLGYVIIKLDHEI